jgi:steroid delta-isomerase-like uncharacterized protein
VEHPNIAIARTIYEAFNARDFDRGLAVIADHAVWLDVPTGTTFRGPAEFRRNYEQWFTKFPDGECEVVHAVAAGDEVVVECIDHGTNTGPMETPYGVFPPTGRRIKLPFCDIFRIEDGKITEGRSYFNFAEVLSQLGLMDGLLTGEAPPGT